MEYNRRKLTDSEKKKAKRGLCITSFCRNKHRKAKGVLNGGNYCDQCRHRRMKERDPVAYDFKRLKRHAKSRGKEFTLTMEEFRKFCDETGYTENKGRGWHQLHIDRIDVTKGYSIDNMQVLTCQENSRKRYYEYDPETGEPREVSQNDYKPPF